VFRQPTSDELRAAYKFQFWFCVVGLVLGGVIHGAMAVWDRPPATVPTPTPAVYGGMSVLDTVSREVGGPETRELVDALGSLLGGEPASHWKVCRDYRCAVLLEVGTPPGMSDAEAVGRARAGMADVTDLPWVMSSRNGDTTLFAFGHKALAMAESIARLEDRADTQTESE
jgi:hypothetical protein